MSQSSYFSNSSAPRVPVNPYAKTTKQVPRSRIRDPTNLPQKPSNLGQNSNVPPVAAGNPHFPLPPPSNHRPQQNQSSRLLKVCDAYPAIYQGIFSSKFDTFNKLQTEVYDTVAQTDENVVVAAPTGSGKTVVFEMAIIRLLQRQRLEDPSLGTTKNFSKMSKIVYIAPSKALCDERMRDWEARFSRIGLAIGRVTGDTKPGESMRLVASSHVILTTPEKWDSITRKWKEHIYLLGNVSLLMIDEVHLLGDKSRGATLESVITRMKTVRRTVQERETVGKGAKKLSASFMRMIAVSATLPNVADIGAFVCAPPSSTFCFGNSYRPVPLTTFVKSCGFNTNEFFFDKSLNNFVPSIVSEYSADKSTIVFCHSKKDTENLSIALGKGSKRISDNTHRAALADARSKASDYNLKQALSTGTAFHHAGLHSSDRHLVESLFMKNLIKVLCATSTLAMGVNLPAHLVVIKGTRCWRGGGSGGTSGHQDIDIATLTQMIGRAGRPGLDTSGVAVVMTDNRSKPMYEKKIEGSEVIESMLRSTIIETLNAEISQHVIKDVPTALLWIKSTFYYIRVKIRPNFYDVDGTTNQEVEHYLRNMIMSSLEALHERKIIRLVDSLDIFPEDASLVMAQHIVPFNSMKMFIDLRPDSFGAEDLLHVLSQCPELQVQLRRSEKKLLNEMHKNSKYRIKSDLAPSKFRVNVPSHKAFIMLQASISGYTCENYTMQTEMVRMVDYATRMLGAIEDYSVGTTLHGKIALESLLLKRSFDTSLWKSTDGMLSQLPGVGEKTTAKLIRQGIVSFGDVLESTLETLERAAGRKSPFGDELKLAAARILSDSLSVHAKVDMVSKEVTCHVTDFDLKGNISSKEGRSYFEKIKRKETVMSKVKKSTYTLAVFTDHPGGLLMWRTDIREPGVHSVKLPEKWGKITVRLVSSFMGLDVQSEIDGGGCPFVSELEKGRGERRGLASIFSPNKRMKVGSMKHDKMEEAVVDANADGIFDIDEVGPTDSPTVTSTTTTKVTVAEQQSKPMTPTNYKTMTTVDERSKAFAAYGRTAQTPRPFGGEEQACNRMGVQRYGEGLDKGNWAENRDDSSQIFEERSSIDINDKWSNMNNRVPPTTVRNPYRSPQTSIDSFTTKKSPHETVGWQSRQQMFQSCSQRIRVGGGMKVAMQQLVGPSDPAIATFNSITPNTPAASATSMQFNVNDTVIHPSYRVGGKSKLRVTPVKSNDYIAQFEYDPNNAEAFLDATVGAGQSDNDEENRRIAYENAKFDETKRMISFGANRSSVTSSGGSGGGRGGSKMRNRKVIGSPVDGRGMMRRSGGKRKLPTPIQVLRQKSMELDEGMPTLPRFSFTSSEKLMMGGGRAEEGGFMMTPSPTNPNDRVSHNPYEQQMLQLMQRNQGGEEKMGGSFEEAFY